MTRELTPVRGYRLSLRLVTPEDADYIFGLRTDPRYNAHLSAVEGTAEDQRRWIEAYQVREREGREYYYVIERLDGVRCGVVRLYDISDESFTWGSWILDHNKPPKAALESALLSFGVGFEYLGLGKALIDVRWDNARALSFYRRLSMTETGVDDFTIYFEYSRTQFLRDKEDFSAILENAT
jgi:RimJ/RimL family protein N-acetyltransferase